MKFNTEVDHYNVGITFDVPENTGWVNSYYFRNCLVTFDLSQLEGKTSSENKEQLEKKIRDLYTDIAMEGTFYETSNILVYSIKPKKLKGFRYIEVFEPVVVGHVKYLIGPLKEQSETFKNAVSFELEIDAIHGYY
ncbi:hypothetical protein [Salipaludibacillus sp. CF4.18]|uniref:hypothetical protein n=1 Tax=Salipaludibacillus sp. CF4.18 TaxID=3373081 RepID=UPI003EE6BF77